MIRKKKALIGAGTEAEKVFKINLYRGKRKIGTVVEKVYSGSPVEFVGSGSPSKNFEIFGKWAVARTPEGALAVLKGRFREKGPFAKIFGGHIKKGKAIVYQEYARGKPLNVDDERNFPISRKYPHLIDVWGDNIVKTRNGLKIVDFSRKTTLEELERDVCTYFLNVPPSLKRSIKNFLRRKILERRF